MSGMICGRAIFGFKLTRAAVQCYSFQGGARTRESNISGRMAVADEQVLEGMAGGLRGLLDQMKVDKAVQVLLGRRQIDTTEMFAVMADDREGFRRMTQNTLGLDPQADSVTVAKLVVSWEAAKLKLQVRSQQDAQASRGSRSRSKPTTISL